MISGKEGILGTHTCRFYYFEHIKMETHLLPRSPRPRSLTNHFAVKQVVSTTGPLSFIFYIYLFVWGKEGRGLLSGISPLPTPCMSWRRTSGCKT